MAVVWIDATVLLISILYFNHFSTPLAIILQIKHNKICLSI